MRAILWLGLPSAVALLSMSALLVFRPWARPRQENDRKFHVVLIGASIGQGWRLDHWAERVGETRFSAEALAAWEFDKSALVREVAMRPRVAFHFGRAFLKEVLRPPRRPDLVILKECSSYFPGDLAAYGERMRAWTQHLKYSGIAVGAATVVPVTRRRAMENPGKQESVLSFNRWLRQYSAAERIPLLDLEAAVRDSGSFLRESFAAQDGSHLNSAAYAQLDLALAEILRQWRGHERAGESNAAKPPD